MVAAGLGGAAAVVVVITFFMLVYLYINESAGL